VKILSIPKRSTSLCRSTSKRKNHSGNSKGSLQPSLSLSLSWHYPTLVPALPQRICPDLKGKGADGKTLGTQTTAEHTDAITPGRYGAGCSKADGTCEADQPLSCCPGYVCNSSTETCEVDDTVTSFLELDVKQGKTMVEDCKADRTVHMSRAFEDGRVTDYAFCPLTTGHKAVYDFRNPDLPAMEIDTSSGPVIIAPNSDGSFYTITGAGVTSHAGFPCDSTIDCDPGLICNSETKSCIAGDGNSTIA
jgi:hypothetical protein